MRVAADQIEELPVQSLRQSKVHLVLLAAGLDVRREDREDAFPGDVGAAGAGDGGGAAYLRGRRSGSLLRRQERGRRRNEGDARSPALQNSAQMGFRLSEFRSAARAALKRRALSSAASSVSKSSTGSKSRPATAAMASFGTLPAPARSELSKPASLGRASWRPAARASSAARTKGSSAAPQARRDGARTQLTPRKRRRAAANGKTTRRLRITRRRASGVSTTLGTRHEPKDPKSYPTAFKIRGGRRLAPDTQHAAHACREVSKRPSPAPPRYQLLPQASGASPARLPSSARVPESSRQAQLGVRPTAAARGVWLGEQKGIARRCA